MQRLSYPLVGAKVFNEMLKVEAALGDLSIDIFMKEIIKIRASQLNGGAFGVAFHTEIGSMDKAMGLDKVEL